MSDEIHRIHDVALIFEGGGMRASYTSAFVAQLLRDRIVTDFVAGISAGASNTANYLSGDIARTRSSFVEFAADPNFGDLRTWVRGQGLFNAPYIYEQSGMPGQALPYDFAAFQAHPAQFRIGALEAHTGRMTYWAREDVHTISDLMIRVRASSSLPILMPPVSLDGGRYVDGALGPTGGFAIDAARAAGYERFIVVMTRAREYRKSPQRNRAFFRRTFSRYPALYDGLIKRPARYNEQREELFELERSGAAYLFVPDQATVSNGERDVRKLAASYDLGADQARREAPALKEWLGLS